VTQPPQGPQATVEEARVADDLRELLVSLDRGIEKFFTTVPPALLFVVIPAGIYLLVWRLDWWWLWGSLVTIGAALVVLVVGGLWQESVVVGRAARRFEQRFPEGGAERAVAQRLLPEMTSPHDAPRKLQQALAARSAAGSRPKE
jgi:hypothetical protein